MASTMQPSRANVVMTIAHKLGCRFKPSHFECVVYELSLRECWSYIPSLVSVARHQCGRATARLLNWKMRAFIECRRFCQLDRVITEFSREGIKPIRRTFHLLVSGHLRNRDLDSAKRGIEMMENAGFPADSSTYALIATVYRSLGLDPQVHTRAFDSVRDVDARMATHVLNSITQHFLDVGDETGAAQYIRFFSLTDADGSDIATPGNDITRIAGALSPHQRTGRASPFRINPDIVTFTILIDYLANQRRLCQVHKLLLRMTEAKVKPDSGVVAALIRAYFLNNRDDLAASLFAAMLYPCGADRTSQHLCGIMGMKLVSELPIDVNHIPLTVHIFNAMLKRIMELRGLTGAKFIFRTMRSRNIKPSATTIEIFLNYLDRTENATPRQLIRFLRGMSTAIYGLTLRHFHVILRNILRREKYLTLGSGWNAASKLSPSREYIYALPQGRVLLSSANFDPSNGLKLPGQFRYDTWLRPIVLFLANRGINNDRATIAMHLRHESMVDPTLSTAKDVLRHMIEKGMYPNQYHYAALMDGYAKGGEHGRGRADYAVRQRSWSQLAMRAFHRMVSAGIRPDIPAIDALARAYFTVGAYKVARRILLQLWTQVKPFPNEMQGATLKQLATAFRANPRNGISQQRSLTKQQQKLLNWKIRGFQQEWKQAVVLHGPRILARRLNRCRAWLLKHSWDGAVKHYM
ncbi:hypothetical protein J3A83DRAFT_4373199 [Scleroderma citrinum]